jgi:hypothetical protein
MVSQFANSNANMQMMGAGDAAAVDGTGSSANCWQCGKNGHIHRDCPDNKGNDPHVDKGTPKKLSGVNRNAKFRHDPDSKLNPGQQDELKKMRFGPENFIAGVHSLCEHMIDKGDGKGLQRFNEAHLRRDCKRFKKMQEEARELVSPPRAKATKRSVVCFLWMSA